MALKNLSKIVPMSSSRRIARVMCAWSHTLSATSAILSSTSVFSKASPSKLQSTGGPASDILNQVQSIMNESSGRTLREISPKSSTRTSTAARRVSELLNTEEIKKMDADQLKAVMELVPWSTSKRVAREARERYNLLKMHESNAGSPSADLTRSRLLTQNKSQSFVSVIEKERGWDANHASKRTTLSRESQHTLRPGDIKASFRSQLSSYGSTKNSHGNLPDALNITVQGETKGARAAPRRIQTRDGHGATSGLNQGSKRIGVPEYPEVGQRVEAQVAEYGSKYAATELFGATHVRTARTA